MRGALTSRRTLAAAVVLALAAGVGVGCGGDDGDGGGGGGNDADATALLQRAFSKSIPSAKVNLSAQLSIDGLRGFDKPLTLEATGPYKASKGTLPGLDLDITIGSVGQGQSLQTGFLSTGKRTFLKFGGEYYEQPRARVAAANKQVGSGGKRGGALGLEPSEWVRGAQREGQQTIGGVASDHVTARLNVRTMLEQLNGLARKGAAAVGGATAPDPLSSSQLDEAADAVQDPRFDIYVGKRDGLVHRMSGNLSVKVPEKERARVNGIRSANLRFTIDLTDTGGKQEIEAPATSRPISELSSQLGGAAALSGLGGGQGGGTDTTPKSGTTPQGGSDADAFKRYSQCVDQAKPGDSTAINRCNELLKR